jgi:hypothetical protein
MVDSRRLGGGVEVDRVDLVDPVDLVDLSGPSGWSDGVVQCAGWQLAPPA